MITVNPNLGAQCVLAIRSLRYNHTQRFSTVTIAEAAPRTGYIQ